MVSAPFALGEEWANTPGLQLHLKVDAQVESVTTENLLANTPTGRTDRTVVAHATLTFAERTCAVNGAAKGKATGQIDWEY